MRGRRVTCCGASEAVRVAGTCSVAPREPRDEAMRRPGSILLISCYELGHQPLGIASPLGFLERAGYAPDALDISVERFDREKMARARFVGISVPLHTALRLAVRGERSGRTDR